MALGFSDRAAVYLNGRAVFHGTDAYRSRDYRFLGSIGWYDTVYLPLEAGDNAARGAYHSLAVAREAGGELVDSDHLVLPTLLDLYGLSLDDLRRNAALCGAPGLQRLVDLLTRLIRLSGRSLRFWLVTPKRASFPRARRFPVSASNASRYERLVPMRMRRSFPPPR